MVLKELCALRGVSGDEGRVREFIRQCVEPFATSVKTDRMGNLIAFKRGTGEQRRHILLTAHMDEAGMVVKGIYDDKTGAEKGLIRYDTAGEIDPRVVVSKPVRIGDDEVPGVIGAKAIHLQSAEDRARMLPHDKLCIDVGAKNQASAEKLVEPGDAVTFESRWVEFGDGLVKARALDDRIGCMVMMSVLEGEYPCDVTCVFTVQEEIGSRGAAAAAYGVESDAALILDQMIDAVHQALIVQTTGESAMAILGIGQGDFESLQSAAQLAGSGRLFEIMDVLIDAKEKLKYNDMAEIVLEMTVLKLCSEGAAPAMEAPQVRNSAPKTQRPAQSAPRPQPELARSAAQPPARSAAPISDTRDGQADAVQKAQAAVQRENTATAPKGAGVDVQALKKKMTAVLKKKAPLDGKMFEKGRLIQKDAAHYDLCFFEDSGDQMACDRCTRSQANLEKLASDIVGRKIQLKIKSVKKNFSDMTLAEKTAAIVGNVPVVRK